MTVALGSNLIERIKVSELAIVVLDDLGSEAESAEFVREVTRLPGERKKVDVGRFRIDNRLMRTPEGILVIDRTVSYISGERQMKIEGNARFAYDFVPEIDERTNSGPSTSYLKPLPEAKAPRNFAGGMGMGTVAIGVFVLAGIRILLAMPQGSATEDEVAPPSVEPRHRHRRRRYAWRAFRRSLAWEIRGRCSRLRIAAGGEQSSLQTVSGRLRETVEADFSCQ